jgi:hypothetical protein
MVKRLLALALPLLPSLLLVTPAAQAADFYVAPNASSSGTGTMGSPWTLQNALNQPSAVHPGDTIWLRGGTYTGKFDSHLNGTSSNPIKVKQYPGERARIDGNVANPASATLIVNGSYTWFWGFEIFNSDPTRYTSNGLHPPRRVTAVSLSGVGTRLINMVLHDTSQGVLTGSSTDATEVSGSLIYYNGWDSPDRGHGHGIYIQNDSGNPTKKVYDNIIHSQFDYGLHGYTSSTDLDNIEYKGNTVFDNGALSSHGYGTNILLGGQVRADNGKVTANMTYTQGHAGGNNLGYNAGCSNTTVTNNYFSNSSALTLVSCGIATMSGNTFYGVVRGFSSGSFPNNTYLSSRPTGVKVFVRPNAYESGRANITVYNWANQSTVSADVSGILSDGDGYEVRDAQDFYGAPVLTGTYNGSPLVLPMTGLSVATPVGVAAPPHTGREFNAFVLLPASSQGVPTPTRTPTSGGGASTPVPTRTPTPSSGGTNVTFGWGAEGGVLTAPMAIYTSTATFGGKYITSSAAESGTATWTINVPETGRYVLWCRLYAGSTASNSAYFKVDGGTEDTFDIDASGTWKWRVVNGRGSSGVPMAINPRIFSLSAGTHTIRLRSRESYVKFDRLILTNRLTWVPTDAP